MSTFAKIINAIKRFGYPYEPDIYTGEAERYFTYNYAADEGTLFGDNGAGSAIVSVQIHFFLPADDNFIKIKNQIRSELEKQGFTFPEITVIRENKMRHIIFECDAEEELEE